VDLRVHAPLHNAPDKLKAGSDVSGPLRGLPDQVTPDGYAVNTLQPFDPPHNEKEPTLPPQDMATIGDELSDKGISWAWYAGGRVEGCNGHAKMRPFKGCAQQPSTAWAKKTTDR
jgi:hypothetical protein